MKKSEEGARRNVTRPYFIYAKGHNGRSC